MEKYKRRPGVWGKICWAWRTRNEPIGGPQVARWPLPKSDQVLIVVLIFAFWPAAWVFYRYRRAEIDRQFAQSRKLGATSK